MACELLLLLDTQAQSVAQCSVSKTKISAKKMFVVSKSNHPRQENLLQVASIYIIVYSICIQLYTNLPSSILHNNRQHVKHQAYLLRETWDNQKIMLQKEQ